ncbi:MAG: zinc-dependent alcohol dehydrogenase [Acidimicrobiales bacterium]
MRALEVLAPGDVAVRDVADPVAGDGEVLVAPILSGMCGTDLELIDGAVDPAYVRYPLVLGHEWVGEILGELPGVAAAGDTVVVEGIIPCGACAECRRGATNRCVTYDEIGFTRSGAIADRIAVPAHLVHRVDPSVDHDDASMVEPMAVVWRGLTRIARPSGQHVCVIGDGTIAMLAAYLVRHLDPESVVVVGRRDAQERLAELAGADEFTTGVPDAKFDLVIEAAGTGPSASTAISLADRGATVVLLGLAPHGTTIQLAPEDVVNADQLIQGSFAYTRTDWAAIVTMLNAGQLHPSFLVTHRFHLNDALDALAVLRGGVSDRSPRGKVTIALR